MVDSALCFTTHPSRFTGAKMLSTKRCIEQRIIKRREQEARTTELKQRLVENNIYAGYGKSDLTVEKKRRALSEGAERRELLTDYSYVKAEQDKIRKAQITMLEEQLADELSKRKAESMRYEMDKRRICDSSEELRQLKERLHMAKVNKERAQQLLEIEVRKEKHRLADHSLAEHMENERLEQQELEHKLDIEKRKQRERVKVINQQQIAMKEASREEALKEYIKERKQVEELVAKIAEEDAKEAKARSEKQVESRHMLQKFMLEQKANQEKIEAEERAENERIEQFARDKREREERMERERQEKEKEKTRVLNAMLGKMEAKNKEAEELEILRNELHFEELQAEARRLDEMRMRKKLEDREAKMRDELMKKFAEDDRLEQVSEHKRRMKVEQHKREAERLVELRREMYELAREKEREEQDALRADEDQRKTIIEEERRRLLREHGRELKKFLPKHTLESMEDYQLLFGEDA